MVSTTEICLSMFVVSEYHNSLQTLLELKITIRIFVAGEIYCGLIFPRYNNDRAIHDESTRRFYF